MGNIPEKGRRLGKSPYEEMTAYIAAIERGEAEVFHLRYLVEFSFYSDEIPSEGLVSYWHPDFPFMKCRGGTIFGISKLLKACVRYGTVTDPTILQRINDFSDRQWEYLRCRRKGEFMTSREDIEFVNETLKMVIGDFEKRGFWVDKEEVRRELEMERERRRSKAFGKGEEEIGGIGGAEEGRGKENAGGAHF